MTDRPTRRTVLRAAAVGTVGLLGTGGVRRRGAPYGIRVDTFGTVRDERTRRRAQGPGRVLFRAGENYYYGGRRNLAVGNTEVVAGMIRDRTGADLYKIEPADRLPGLL